MSSWKSLGGSYVDLREGTLPGPNKRTLLNQWDPEHAHSAPWQIVMGTNRLSTLYTIKDFIKTTTTTIVSWITSKSQLVSSAAHEYIHNKACPTLPGWPHPGLAVLLNGLQGELHVEHITVIYLWGDKGMRERFSDFLVQERTQLVPYLYLCKEPLCPSKLIFPLHLKHCMALELSWRCYKQGMREEKCLEIKRVVR